MFHHRITVKSAYFGLLFASMLHYSNLVMILIHQSIDDNDEFMDTTGETDVYQQWSQMNDSSIVRK